MRNFFFKVNKTIPILAGCILINSCNINGPIKLSGNSVFNQKRIYSNNIVLHKTTIYPDVVKYEFNSDFIIAKQKPNKSSYAAHWSFDLYSRYTTYAEYMSDKKVSKTSSWQGLEEKIEGDSLIYKLFLEKGATLNNTSNDISISLMIADSLIGNDPNYRKIFENDENYWIIDNSRDTLIGPLTKTEYLIEWKKLKIPDDLKLD
jgi:hypothetical protein